MKFIEALFLYVLSTAIAGIIVSGYLLWFIVGALAVTLLLCIYGLRTRPHKNGS